MDYAFTLEKIVNIFQQIKQILHVKNENINQAECRHQELKLNKRV